MNARSTKSSDRVVIVPATTSNASSYPLSGTGLFGHNPSNTPNEQIKRAVYAYIQARRALGDTTANTADIARALRLPLRLVDAAVGGLSDQGVKVR